MLDANTKRNIDAARNVLVGKVPDPKAQVEQITTALIYKFMDDLDKETVELGGKAKFFTGDYEKYTWTKVLDTRLSGEARLDLYVQAITNMSKNPNLPQLFRDIFKGAFLPYNDSQTLSLFLKEINNFTYSHSEELGNAFEYLLSVLGSQGDAGQFRTPRHIIDFIVGVVDPQKTDTILDPACGTAGFLISAYKHIRKHNSSNYKPDKETAIGESASELILLEKETYTGDKLTTAEREKLPRNIQGYDISPDMVKLSLVNLYLHGFTSPNIYEYDTLTSEKRWNESFDVILANPPFMTPKGGIRPHKRFQVQANRSEVLFVDYILEHLNLKGRAGVIVPEGVIFKSENAYKQLRKLLVEDGLFAVVSLPPGVFNPYSGVKTSILFFDNEVAKLTDEILFFWIKNDGYDLGAQRRKIDKNHLPEALTVLQAWKQGKKRESNLALWVKKKRIGEFSDYTLDVERYRKEEEPKNQNWPYIELEKLVETITPPRKIKKSDFGASGNYPVVDQSQDEVAGWSDDEKALVRSEAPLVVFGDHTCTVKYLDKPFVQGADGIKILKTGDDILPKYLYYMLKFKPIKADGYKRHFAKLKRHKIPLPPVDLQRQIVEQIEVKHAAIEAARVVIENLERERSYFGYELEKLEGVEWVKLGEVCGVVSGGGFPTVEQGLVDQEIPFLKVSDMNLPGNEKAITRWNNSVSRETLKKLRVSSYPKGTVIFPKIGAAIATNKKRILTAESAFDNNVMGLVPSENIDGEFLYYFMLQFDLSKWASSSSPPSMKQSTVKQAMIPLPPLEMQRELVDKISEEERTSTANRRLIELMMEKIDKVLEGI